MLSSGDTQQNSCTDSSGLVAQTSESPSMSGKNSGHDHGNEHQESHSNTFNNVSNVLNGENGTFYSATGPKCFSDSSHRES